MKRFNKFVLAIALMSTLVSSAVAHAATATMSLSPASGSYNIGTTFSVGIYENSANEPVNVAEASLAFDGSQLSLTGISCSSAFEIAAPGSNNGISCGTVTAKTGSQLVGTATFRTLVGSGSGAVTFNSATVYSANTNSNIVSGTGSANYNFTTPVIVPVVPVPAPTPVPAPVPVVVPVVVVKVFTVNITVENSRGNTIQGATVVFNGKTATSDSNGRVSFSNVNAGSYDVKATLNNLSVSTKITVNNKNKTTQNFMVTLPRAKSSRFGFLLGTGTGLFIIGGGLVISRKRRTVIEQPINSVTKKTAPAKTVTKKAVKKTVKSSARLVTAKQ